MNTTLFFTFFILYLLIMVVVGWRVSRKQSGEDYIMGSRKLGPFLLLGTVLATQIGTGSSMGAAGFGYNNGAAGLLYGVGGFVGIVLAARLFASAHKYKFFTMSEEISFYYGGNKYLKGLVSIVIFVASLGWLGAHVLGGSLYLSWVTGIDLTTAKVITVLGFGVYVIIGGYLAVVWTDCIQSIILFCGFIVVAVLAVPAAGGFEAIQQAFTKGELSFLGLQNYGVLPALSLIVAIAVGGVAVPSFRHRIYSARDIGSIKKSFYGTGVLYAVFALFPVLIGMSARVMNPALENNNFAIPYMAMEVLPLGLGILILISGLSATMSSGDSDAIAGVTILMTDIYSMVFKKLPEQNKMVKYSRIATVLTLGIALLMTIFAKDITKYITSMVSTTLSGLAVAAILGKYWKRATWQGGIAALLGGSIVSIATSRSAEIKSMFGNTILLALGGALLACVVVSLLTPANTLSEEEALARVMRDREQ